MQEFVFLHNGVVFSARYAQTIVDGRPLFDISTIALVSETTPATGRRELCPNGSAAWLAKVYLTERFDRTRLDTILSWRSTEALPAGIETYISALITTLENT